MAKNSGDAHGLQVDRQRSERRVSRLQRGAWLVLGLLVIAVLLGLFGGQGWLSTTQARTPDGALELRYERLTRRSAPATLDIRIAPAYVESDEIRLQLDREYAGAARIERITPEPLRVESGAGRLRYVFASEPGSTARVVFYMQMEKIGPLRGKLILLPDHSLDFTQFVYP